MVLYRVVSVIAIYSIIAKYLMHRATKIFLTSADLADQSVNNLTIIQS